MVVVAAAVAGSSWDKTGTRAETQFGEKYVDEDRFTPIYVILGASCSQSVPTIFPLELSHLRPRVCARISAT